MTPTALAISGSPSATSKSRRLLLQALDRLRDDGIPGRLVDLYELPAEALLGRTRSAGVDAALASVAASRVVIVGTPVYRASFSGLLKVFFDLLPQDALVGKVVIPIATGGTLAHQLVLDHALRPLAASVGGVIVSTGVYAIDAQFTGGVVDPLVVQGLDRAVAEAVGLAAQLSSISR
jgi:FMN reductase